MKKVLLLVFLLVLASVAGAEPICGNGNLSTYVVQGYACEIGDLIFSNFGYTPTGTSNSISAQGVAVDVISEPGNVGFQFNGGWSVRTQNGSTQILDSLITFRVTGPAITSMHLWFNGADFDTGLAEVVETYCLGGTQTTSCPSGSSGQLHVTSFGHVFEWDLKFAPVKMISVSKDINVNSGSNGTASISQVINTFDYDVPEPLSLLLCGTGLFALGFLRRRK